MSFDHKDDLRHRMVDLEKKLADSEKDRCKLEKTCNALMKALREGEKLRYKSLNKEYEKFLQDYTVRKRRNDIILKSLCKIEDRSRALFAKTERLKLLKDRYISYLKISEVKTDEVSSQLTFLFSSPSQNTTDNIYPKSIRWKAPVTTESKSKKSEEKLFMSCKNSDEASELFRFQFYVCPDKYLNTLSEGAQETEGRESAERTGLNYTYDTETSSITMTAQNKLDLDKIESNFKNPLGNPLGNPLSIQVKSEEFIKTRNQKEPEKNHSSKLNSDELEKNVAKDSERHNQESIGKVKEMFLLGKDNEKRDTKQGPCDGKAMDKPEIESCEKDPAKKQDVMTSKISDSGDKKFENLLAREKADDQVGSNKSLPMGLDGIDYQDETYPESYYEQPVHHHNLTSIAADVILEEDETETEAEDEEKDFDKSKFSRRDSHESETWERSSGHRTWNDPNRKDCDIEEPNSVFEKFQDEIKSQVLKSEKSSESKQSDEDASKPKSDKSENLVPEKSDGSKPPAKSNFIHLLESDSESFQIEHGENISGNEGSDFDFSFH